MAAGQPKLPEPSTPTWPVRAVRVTSPAFRRLHSSTRAPAYSSVATIARSRTPRQAAARSARPCSILVSASGSPGLGIRARFTVIRSPAWAYRRVTAASA